MSEKRTLIGKFIHSSWINLNIRCGKYKHLRTVEKCRTYENIQVEFTREEYKNWCLLRKDHILNLSRPSLDRKDKNKNYSLDNIQIIELPINIRKDKTLFDETHGVCYRCSRRKEIHLFAKDKRRQNGRCNIRRLCDNKRRKIKNVL